MRQEKRRSGFWGFFAKVFTAAAFLIAVYFVWKPAFWAQPPVPDATVTPPGLGVLATPSPSATSEPSPQQAGIPVRVEEIEDTRFLELVNEDHSVSDETKNIGSAWPTVAVSTKRILLHDTALEALNDLFDAASEEGFDSFYLGSGYRGEEAQREVYENASDRSYVQKPGHSEHHTGLAADIFALGVGQYDMAETSEATWLAENAWQYGFILRYPEGKEDITKISYEPWHFRYLGRFHAWYCETNNLCFEEYINLLKNSGEIQAELDGLSYTVLYQVPENGIIILPDKQKCIVSGDNTGGYIITAWE